MKVMEALFDMDKLESTFGVKNMENFEYEAYAKRMKDEEKQKSNAKNSGNALPADQTSVASDLQDSDFLVSEVSSEVSDEADSSSNYEIGSDLNVLDEMAQLQLDCKIEVDEKLDCKNETMPLR